MGFSPMGLVSLQEEEIGIRTYTAGRPREDIGKRWPPSLCRHLDCEKPRTARKYISVVRYGSPGKGIGTLASTNWEFQQFLGYLVRMPPFLNFAASLDDLRPQETF